MLFSYTYLLLIKQHQNKDMIVQKKLQTHTGKYDFTMNCIEITRYLLYFISYMFGKT